MGIFGRNSKIFYQFDITIVDGGHTMLQEIIFEEMFPEISSNGVYLVEDLHTSYWEEYGGAVGRPDRDIILVR
ncbi:hypothetical protein [Peribacillus simplex]|uniref:hypothetical protein n=1 Tax=Peribacillus simplex TaxID=1478 RepID=UPI0024C148D6|nr:hypothetical protein [Peribacillus simplex]WHY97945.1 hypothetical protein QNH37_01655 [Peribacillus simplex]